MAKRWAGESGSPLTPGPVQTYWAGEEDGERWELRIVPDSDGEKRTIALSGSYSCCGVTTHFDADPSPDQARAMAKALLVRADEADPQPQPESDSGGEGHRIEIEFDGLNPSVRLIHPESGCPQGEEDEDCWLTDWLENEGCELLRGKLTLPVRWEVPADRDHPLFQVLAPKPSATPDTRELVEALETLQNGPDTLTPDGLRIVLTALTRAHELLGGDDGS